MFATLKTEGKLNMNITDYYVKDGEKPLDRIVDDGGFCGIFRTMAIVGDSLSSGEFETVDENGAHHWYDLYEYSWGQYIARMTGATVYNFSKGGMTAKEYWESFADINRFWAPTKAAQAYVFALGVNDLLCQNQEPGTAKDYLEDKETFACYFGKIINRLKKISPDAKFFFMTMPRNTEEENESNTKKAKHAQLMYDFAEEFSNSYVLDFFKYAPIYDEEFNRNFSLSGHLNPMGYMLTAKMTASYIDYIIRKNMPDFKTVGLINTGVDFGVLD